MNASSEKLTKPLEKKIQVPCNEAEKSYLKSYIKSTPRGGTLQQYWETCALDINNNFPQHSRNGSACKSLAQRMYMSPSTKPEDKIASEEGCQVLPTFVDVGIQTDLSLPPNSDCVDDFKSGDWVFMEPKKVLKDKASSAADLLNKSALKRLRSHCDLSQKEKARIIDILGSGSSREIARAIMCCPSVASEISTLTLFDMELDARECATRSSALCQKQYYDLKNFEWTKLISEMVNKQSFLLDVLLAVALPTGKIGNTKATEDLVPALGAVYGILMKQRFHELSVVQKVVSITLANEQTHQKVYDRLQPLGVSLSHQGMLETMTSISSSFSAELVESVKNRQKFRIVGDNINFTVGVAQERKNKGKVSHQEHWFGSAAILQNVSFPDLPTHRQHDLRTLPVETFLLDEEEWNDLVFNLSSVVAKILVEFFPWLHFAKSAVSDTYDLPDGLNNANTVIPLPILHKDEKSYGDVVDILDSYQDISERTYEEAEKPLSSIHTGGDQLTRERFTGAKRLRASALTATERYANLHPITIELFHLQMTVLTTFYQLVYNTKHTDCFTLHAQKIRLLRKDADGSDVKNHYNSCKELAVSVIKAYLVEAACEQFGLPNTDTVPENIPDHTNMSADEIKEWLVNQVRPIVSTITSDSRNVMTGNHVETNYTDSITCYGRIVFELGLVFMELCENVKRPKRDRLIPLMKYLMLILKGHKDNKSKYALELLRFLMQQLALLSEQAAHEVFYGLFVNTGKSFIPCDLQMEHLVRLTKGHLRSMCSNVTDESLSKRSSAFFGMKNISNNYDEKTGTLKRSQKHKRLSSEEDEKKIIKELRSIRPFLYINGRQTDTLKMLRNPMTKVNMENTKSWIEEYKFNFFYER